MAGQSKISRMNANFLSGVLACPTALMTATKAATAKDAADAKGKAKSAADERRLKAHGV
jgi:hypothetical protein